MPRKREIWLHNTHWDIYTRTERVRICNRLLCYFVSLLLCSLLRILFLFFLWCAFCSSVSAFCPLVATLLTHALAQFCMHQYVNEYNAKQPKGVKEDFDEASDWYRRSAGQKFAAAMVRTHTYTCFYSSYTLGLFSRHFSFLPYFIHTHTCYLTNKWTYGNTDIMSVILLSSTPMRFVDLYAISMLVSSMSKFVYVCVCLCVFIYILS